MRPPGSPASAAPIFHISAPTAGADVRAYEHIGYSFGFWQLRLRIYPENLSWTVRNSPARNRNSSRKIRKSKAKIRNSLSFSRNKNTPKY